ncbi:MAG TPA: FAD-binding oxidoreductase [Bryobacteraceae bacterium]|jgi:glycine/D-amino acid oxidase-like deaminating enzyme|nr:FAD-binding oxidoreductase [Bryobacteraceae bacterium]
MPSGPIVIAGAGIIGASIGYHLAKRGAAVTILDAAPPGSGATGKSLGWINATFSKRPRAYFDLNLAGIAAWRRLQRELDDELKVQWGGSVAWFPPGPDADELRANVRNHQEWGYPVHSLSEAELHGLLPQVTPDEFGVACHSEPEGAVDPLEALTTLLAKARQCGAHVRFPCRVTGIHLSGNRVKSIQTTDGPLEANVFVLACGVGSPALARMAGIDVPLKDSPGVLLHTAPAPRLIDRVVLAPGTHFKQSRDGRIVAGGPIVAGAGTAITEASLEQAEEIRRLVAQSLPQMRDIPVERVTLGYRVMPSDEYPILGFAESCRNFYVAATHSGVTLGPLIGQLAALEILDGVQVTTLDPYRPARFT